MKFFHVVIIFLFLLAMDIGFCQEGMRDVIYLKNGGVIHGVIIEQVPGESIKIETSDGNIFVYSYDEIEKIAKERVVNDRTTGYRNIPRLGLMTGESNTLFSVSVINGSQIGDYVYLGFGVGYDNYPNGWMLPLFVDFKADFIKGKASPFAFADVGYALGWVNGLSGSDWGGMMGIAGLGGRLSISKRSSFIAELGYKFQQTKELYLGWDGWNFVLLTRKTNLDFFTFMVGFII